MDAKTILEREAALKAALAALPMAIGAWRVGPSPVRAREDARRRSTSPPSVAHCVGTKNRFLDLSWISSVGWSVGMIEDLEGSTRWSCPLHGKGWREREGLDELFSRFKQEMEGSGNVVASLPDEEFIELLREQVWERERESYKTAVAQAKAWEETCRFQTAKGVGMRFAPSSHPWNNDHYLGVAKGEISPREIPRPK